MNGDQIELVVLSDSISTDSISTVAADSVL